MRRTAFQTLLIIALVTGAFAQQRSIGSNEPSADRLHTHVTYLAADKLEGRRTGTPGAGEAARYIADLFSRLGLRPGGNVTGKIHGRTDFYMQPFPYVASVALGKGNAMSFASHAGAAPMNAAAVDVRLAEDWMPFSWSANARVQSSPVVFVGYGIIASELNYDDYSGVELKNRIALALAGTPDGDNPHGSFARYTDLRFKAAAARDHGARALLIIAREENFKDDNLSHLRTDDNSAGDAGIPVVAISRQVARRALAAATGAPTLEELEKALSGASRTNSEQVGHKNFSALLPNVAFAVTSDLVHREAPAMNVVGILDGSDQKLKNEAIVIGAHYDHLGRGGQGSLAPREGEVHHGADDNASGVAAVLELARFFSNVRQRPRRTIVFIAFSGEEEGLLGSSYYVNHAVVPLAQTIAMINMDMIGRLKDDKLIIGGVGTATEWKSWIAQTNGGGDLNVKTAATAAANNATPNPQTVENTAHATASGQAVGGVNSRQRFALTTTEDGYGPSDHSSFYSKQVPVLFFWTGTHEDYHKPTDTADKINYEGEARIVAYVRDIVQTIDESEKRPGYTVAKSDAVVGRSTGFRVYLGTIPNYAEATDGVKLDGVRDDSPAAKAGLKAGDRIVRLAGRDVRNVYDYTYALGEMRAGQEYEIEIVRGSERLMFKITPAARK